MYIESQQVQHFNDITDEEVVVIAQQGNQDAIEFILKKYSYIPKTMAKHYFLNNSSGDKGDLIQEGMLGLYEAIQDFAHGKGYIFKNFARMCVKRNMISAIIASNRQKLVPAEKQISCHKKVYEGDDSRELIEHLDSRIEGPEETIFKRETANEVYRLLDEKLTDLERRAFIYFLNGYTYREISIKLNRQKKTIDNALNRARKKIELIREEVMGEAK